MEQYKHLKENTFVHLCLKFFKHKWTKPFFTLAILFILMLTLPSSPIDPWNLLNLKKIATMIFALVFIQILGSLIAQWIGLKAGAILTGFLGGLISSTATTATLARQSKTLSVNMNSIQLITFLSATAAMLFEGMSMLLIGTKEIHLTLLLIFIGPILATVVMIILRSRKIDLSSTKIETSSLKILTLLKLSAFILAILFLSSILQKFLGQNGLYLFTFLVSLFEIHGSIIANIQLYYAGAISIQVLGNLLAISITASYLSKLFLIFSLSSPNLKTKSLKCTALLFFSLVASWITFSILN